MQEEQPDGSFAWNSTYEPGEWPDHVSFNITDLVRNNLCAEQVPEDLKEFIGNRSGAVFAPKQPATREECAKMLAVFIQLIANE